MALEDFRTDENSGGTTEKIKREKRQEWKSMAWKEIKREKRKNPVAGNWVLGLLT